MLTHNSAALKIEVRKHVLADAVIQGDYWNEDEQKGCFIGCLAKSNDINLLAKRYGFDQKFTRLCEGVFEGLPIDDAKQFFSDIGENIHDGVDTECVVWTVLRKALERLPEQDCIKTVIDLLKRIEAGEDRGGMRTELSAAADAARSAAYAAARAAARAAADAADAAAYAAAYAASAAETRKQAADIISAIKA